MLCLVVTGVDADGRHSLGHGIPETFTRAAGNPNNTPSSQIRPRRCACRSFCSVAKYLLPLVLPPLYLGVQGLFLFSMSAYLAIRLSARKLRSRKLYSTLIASFLVIFFFLSDWTAIGDLGLYGLNTITPEKPPGTWSQHPVVVLHERARKDFDALLKRQSRTPEEAEAKYTRRYGRKEPPGFHGWVKYALAQESPIVDDFDTLSHAVHRFANFSAEEIKHRMREVTERRNTGSYNGGVERCSFSEERFGQGCRHFADPLTNLLGDAKRLVPDFEFLLNVFDEPSVLLGHQGTDEGTALSWKDLSHSSIATVVAEACKLRGNSTWSDRRAANIPIETYGLPFVQDGDSTRDLCQHPEYSSAHGFLMCPVTFKHMSADVPILSQAAPYPFADILYPSTHYGLPSSLYWKYEDRPWSWKKNAVYWIGSTTGGLWSQSTWRHGHRQRLAALGMHKEERNFTYLRSARDAPQGIQAYASSVFDSGLFDVTLGRSVGCDNDAVCDAQNRFFFDTTQQPPRRDAESRPYRYRFVLDIDGNSYSGRFYRLLASRSVPLKVTIFREWHDERLVPWLHYVPVSLEMDELPELMRFLATTAEGQRVGRRIAETGRAWYFKAMTPTHQGIYLYRLMLELAWLLDKSRPVG